MSFSSLSTMPSQSKCTPRWKRNVLETSQISNHARHTRSKTPKSGKRTRTPAGDRFIPALKNADDLDRARMALSFSSDSLCSAASASADGDTISSFAANLHSSVLHDMSPTLPLPLASGGVRRSDLPGSKILSFSTPAPLPRQGTQNANASLYRQSAASRTKRRPAGRSIPSAPHKILDAPGMQGDFYLNLLDWGASGTLAVALHDSVYLWNASTGAIEHLCETSLPSDFVTSVAWSENGQYLSVGLNSATVQLWDANKMTQLRSWQNHAGRVGTMAWRGRTLTTGSRDARIHHNDVRVARPLFRSLATHTEEVCGLQWSPSGAQLASGGNDNAVCVWDGQSHAEPRFRLGGHTAAVKALSWCPRKSSLLATGGGTADRHLRFWNTASGTCVKSVDTKSQVSGIRWSHDEMELVTSHGFSQNQLTVWKYSTMARMADLKGHSERILHLAQSPDGTSVASGGADETLRFWKVFDHSAAARRTNSSRKASALSRSHSFLNIR